MNISVWNLPVLTSEHNQTIRPIESKVVSILEIVVFFPLRWRNQRYNTLVPLPLRKGILPSCVWVPMPPKDIGELMQAAAEGRGGRARGGRARGGAGRGQGRKRKVFVVREIKSKLFVVSWPRREFHLLPRQIS